MFPPRNQDCPMRDNCTYSHCRDCEYGQKFVKMRRYIEELELDNKRLLAGLIDPHRPEERK